MELEEDVCVTFYYLIKFCGISATHKVFMFTSLYFLLRTKKIRMEPETSEKQKEVTDFVASDLPDQSLPSEKDTIQLALLLC